MRNALVGAAVKLDPWHCQQPLAQPPGKPLDALVLAVARLAGQGEGAAHANDLMGRQGA
ncbi:hypothetical protein D3C80_1904720 [compost metagenome]